VHRAGQQVGEEIGDHRRRREHARGPEAVDQHPRLSGEKPGVRNRRRDGAGFKKAMEGNLSRIPGAYQHVLCEAHPVDAAGHEVDDVARAPPASRAWRS